MLTDSVHLRTPGLSVPHRPYLTTHHSLNRATLFTYNCTLHPTLLLSPLWYPAPSIGPPHKLFLLSYINRTTLLHTPMFAYLFGPLCRNNLLDQAQLGWTTVLWSSWIATAFFSVLPEALCVRLLSDSVGRMWHLIGINYFRQEAALRGCINDARNIEVILCL